MSKGRKPAARFTDMGAGHGSYPPTPIMEGSPNVRINQQPAARKGDALVSHSKPSRGSSHPRTIAEGSKTVLINGRPAARLGDKISCGGVVIGGSGNVIIGDNPQLPEPVAPPVFDDDPSAPPSKRGAASALEPHAAQSRMAARIHEQEGAAAAVASWRAFYAEELIQQGAVPNSATLTDPLERAGLEQARQAHAAVLVEEEEEEEEEGKEEIIEKETLYIGVFFDGTWQHRDICASRSDRDISNVVKLHDLYNDALQNHFKVYAPGIGIEPTELDEHDEMQANRSSLAGAAGLGAMGAGARLIAAMVDVQEFLDVARYERVVFDVFGFSRGAALARHFINVLTASTEMFEHPTDWPFALDMEVRFAGLFDTVANLFWPGGRGTGPFNLNLSSGNVQRVVHLTAHHERRRLFPLTRISDEQGNLPSGFTEIAVPGAHTDVGGGYENPEIDPANIERVRTVVAVHRLRHPHDLERRLLLAREAENRGHRLVRSPDSPSELLEVHEEMRDTHKELAIYHLHTMYEHALEAGVPLDEMDETSAEHRIPPGLVQRLAAWQAAGAPLDEATSPVYLGNFIHTSHDPFNAVNRPTSNGERVEYYNDPSATTTGSERQTPQEHARSVERTRR